MALTMPATVTPAPASPPTSLTVITFHRRQWASRDNRLTLTLAATAQLVWPSSTASPASSSNIFNTKTVPAARVSQLVRSGRLWIGTDGRSVQFGVKATLGGKSCIKSEQLCKLKELIADWPWSELGLVRDRSRGEDGDLVLRHPPSPDGLYTPYGIPHARLDRVDCQLRFNYCPDGFRLHVLPIVRLPEQKSLARPPLSKEAATSKHETRGKKKRRAKAKKKPKPPPKTPKPPRTIQPARTLTNPDCLLNETDGSWERTCVIVEAALATFIGVKGRQVGARPLDQQSLPSGAPSLLDVAPAVWSYRLFRVRCFETLHMLVYSVLTAVGCCISCDPCALDLSSTVGFYERAVPKLEAESRGTGEAPCNRRPAVQSRRPCHKGRGDTAQGHPIRTTAVEATGLGKPPGPTGHAVTSTTLAFSGTNNGIFQPGAS